jgi:hypothetical protein
VPRGQCDGSLCPYSRFSRPDIYIYMCVCVCVCVYVKNTQYEIITERQIQKPAVGGFQQQSCMGKLSCRNHPTYDSSSGLISGIHKS